MRNAFVLSRKHRWNHTRTLVTAGLAAAFVVASALVLPHVLVGGRPSGAQTPSSGPFEAAGSNAGADWSPNTDPLGPGQETTLGQAIGQAGYPVYTPDTPLAANSSLAHVWMSTEPPTPGLLPNGPQTSIGLSYSSGIVVTIQPWRYGPDAPAFSESQIAVDFQQAASSAPQISMTADTIQGIPVLVIPQNVQGENNPGSVELHLGTSNQNAVMVAVLGRFATADLESVAASIVSQWQQANPA